LETITPTAKAKSNATNPFGIGTFGILTIISPP